MARARFVVRGQVQGVGFRPFVFTLAEEEGLTGFVRNSPRGVVIEVQGSPGSLDRFSLALEHRLPPLARITHLDREPCPLAVGEKDFRIAPSTAGASHAVLISPDTATCPDCLADMRDGRRRRYPFTNCTNCGPRYTITRSIPYDRASTSMACFPMCPDCLAEYENPRDRRFHAQPNACPVCGPGVWFAGPREKRTNELPAEAPEHHETVAQGLPRGDAAIRALAVFLLHGGIAAIKGLGGFHLACLASDHAAVTRLRERKHRPHKPFALMAANLEDVRRFAAAGPEEEALLLGPERPIVLCPFSATGRPLLSPAIAPDAETVGVMLPYTPLHHVLFEHLAEAARQAPGALTALVMTSGNPGGEPICLGNREALEHLGDMAEAFLFHNRDILVRADDSVVRPLPDGQCLFLRRARGYVPRPVPLADPPPGPPLPGPGFAGTGPVRLSPGGCGGSPHPYSIGFDKINIAGAEDKIIPDAGQVPAQAEEEPCVLGVGAELKNTLCLTKGTDAFVSQHIGDMGNLETAAFHSAMRDHLADLLRVEPRAVVRDLHPNFLSSRMAGELAVEKGIPLFTLQHHFAHAHALLAEHRFVGKALVFALDGTGLGDDGVLWGGELLLVDAGCASGPLHARLASFSPMDLPGGEAAIREPWRIAHALLLRLGLDTSATPLPWMPEYRTVADLLPAILAGRINTPLSTSCGRLFDAVAALLGLCNVTSYEGQAAIRLEQAQYTDMDGAENSPENDAPDAAGGPCPGRDIYPAPISTLEDGRLEFGSHALFSAVYGDLARGVPVPAIARRFHRSLAVGLAELASQVAGREGVRHIGLSGGCLQNVALAVSLKRELETRSLVPLTHIALPPGDGCISLGQAAYGRLLLKGMAFSTDSITI